jgi:hypothetical protein
MEALLFIAAFSVLDRPVFKLVSYRLWLRARVRSQGLPYLEPLVSHRGGPGSSPGQVMWDLWRTKWHWGRLSLSTSVSPVNPHSTDCSTYIIYHPGLV